MPIPILWIGLDDEPVVMVNQFLGQVQQDEIILSFGTLVQPPIVGGTLEERREQAMRITHVPVRPAVRMTLTERRLEELLTMLRDTAAMFSSRYNVTGGQGSGEDDTGPS